MRSSLVAPSARSIFSFLVLSPLFPSLTSWSSLTVRAALLGRAGSQRYSRRIRRWTNAVFSVLFAFHNIFYSFHLFSQDVFRFNIMLAMLIDADTGLYDEHVDKHDFLQLRFER